MFKIKNRDEIKGIYLEKFKILKDEIYKKLSESYNIENEVVRKSAENMALIEISREIWKKEDDEYEKKNGIRYYI